MVYDIYEAQEGRPPTSTEFFVALNHWQYFGKTPTLESITYGVSKCKIEFDNDSSPLGYIKINEKEIK